MVERLAKQLGLSFSRPWFKNYEVAEAKVGEHRLYLLKPLTYMNRSGDAIERFFWKKNLPFDHLLVAVDQMDLPPGEFRLKLKGGDAGHNGLKSVMHYTQPENFKRLYLGIGRPEDGTSVVDHVLGEPTAEQAQAIQQAASQAAELVPRILEWGWEKAIHEFNRRS